MKQIPNTVKEAAEFMDQVDPNWWFRINLDKFTQNDSTACVIGQTQSCGFWNFIKLHFGLPADLGPFGNSRDFSPTLNDQWRREIEYRRKPQPKQEPAKANKVWYILNQTTSNLHKTTYHSKQAAIDAAKSYATQYNWVILESVGSLVVPKPEPVWTDHV